MQTDTQLDKLEPAQPTHRAAHWTHDAPNGPMAQLLHSLNEVGAAMDNTYNILQHNEAPISIMMIACHHLKQLIRHNATRASTLANSNSRQETANLKDIDTRVSTQIFSTIQTQDANTLRTIMTGSTWANETLYQCGQTQMQVCELCGDGSLKTPEHIIWSCKHYCDQRFANDLALKKYH